MSEEYFIIQKPSIKDPKTDKYIGGSYKIFDKDQLEIRIKRFKNHKQIQITENDMEALSLDGLFGTDKNGLTYYYSTVDPFVHYYLENTQKQDIVGLEQELEKTVNE